MLNRFLYTAAFLSVSFLLTIPANASLQVTLTANGSSLTVVDGDGNDEDATANVIRFDALTVGSYTFSSHLTATNSSGTPVLAFVESGTNEIEFTGASGTGSTDIEIYASANDFTEPVTPPSLNALTSATFNRSAGGSQVVSDVEVESFLDTGNGLSDSPTGSSIGNDSEGPLSNSIALEDSSVINSLSANYALNLLLKATVTGDDARIDADGTIELTPVPEPTMIVVWSCLGLFGVLSSRRSARMKS